MTERRSVLRVLLAAGLAAVLGSAFVLVRGPSPAGRPSGPAVAATAGDVEGADSAAPRTLVPEDFGAVGDGTTDDTGALQSALSSLREGDQLRLTAGRTYRHGDVLVVDVDGVRLTGPGILLASNEERSALHLRADAVRITDLVLRITGTTRRWRAPDQHRVVLGPHRGLVLERVRVEGSAGAGVYVMGSRGFRLTDVRVEGSRADGVHITDGAEDGVVERPVVLRSGDDGVAVVSYGDDPGPVRRVDVLSPRVQDQSWGRGISVVGGEDVVFRDVVVTGSSSAGIYIATEGAPYDTRSTRRIAVHGAVLRGSNRTASVDHGAVLVSAAARGTLVEDVHLSDVVVEGTRPAAARQVGVLADGGSVAGVRLERFTVLGGGEVFGETVGVAAFVTTGWSVDGRAVPGRGTA